MEIPNLTLKPNIENTDKMFTAKNGNNYNIFLVIAIAIVGLSLGFGYSRLKVNSTNTSNLNTASQTSVISAENLKDASQIQVGKTYGKNSPEFKDVAVGIISKGGQGGEGTHTLEREGGKTQWAALTSSTLDLDLFVGKKVQVHGQTYSSTKAGWLLDVGTIEVLE